MSQNISNQNKLTITHIILIVGFTVMLAAVGVVGYFVLTQEKDNSPPLTATPYTYGNTYVVGENNIAEIEAAAAKEVADGMYVTTMNVDWNFENAKEASYNAYVANDASNHRSVFFEVVLDGETDPIFRSSVIPPGSAIEEIVLTKNIKKGTYPAICTYHLINEETNEIASSLSIEVKLHIEN